MALVFHPHADSHVGTQEQIVRLLEATDPAYVNLCLDTGHVAYYGGDSVALVRQYPERIGYVHLKQVDLSDSPARRDENLGFAHAVRLGAMVEPPNGEPQMMPFIAALAELKRDLYCIVEQDMYPCPPDMPYPIAVRTRQYFAELRAGRQMTRDPVEHLAGDLRRACAHNQRTAGALQVLLVEFADAIWRSLASGGKLVLFGNGGSAADAQHFAAELTGRFTVEREPLAALALTTNTSALTAIANDFDYADVFARQVTALCREGDVVVGISTSGRAANVIRGIEAASARGASAWALTGGDGGQLHQTRARTITVPSSATARIQEMHITIIHAVCALIDDRFPGRTLDLWL